jgi:hypothetical protein
MPIFCPDAATFFCVVVLGQKISFLLVPTSLINKFP